MQINDGRPLRILLVEDNADHAELIKRSFEEHRVGNDLIHLSDGEQALDFLHRRGAFEEPAKSPRPDVILLDLRLPRVDGLDVLRDIKSDNSLRKIPVVVLTTSDTETDIARAYDLHANAYLVKPVGFTKFLDLMRDMGFFWLVWNKSPVDEGE
jgi:CheY-like chemotaxis protein